MENIAEGILSKVGEYMLQLTVNQGRYLFCFKTIVEDLEKEETNLKSAQEEMEQRVQRARNNTEVIKRDVERWRIDVSRILAEVQSLKEEIQVKKSCLNWGYTYFLSRKAAKKTSIMLKRVDDYGKIETVGYPASLPGIEFSAPKDFELFQSSKAAFDQIIEALRNDETNLVGLYGMGGSGKTTLAKKLGIEAKKRGIFNEVVMVVVSQTPNFKDIQSKLAGLLGVELKEEDEEERAKKLYLRFTKANIDTNDKSLVILDDVWKRFDLKSKIGFPFGEDNKHWKILLTTRRQQLCTVMGCQSQIPLYLLNSDEGLTLLKRFAGIDDDSITSELNALAIEVARECKGLPLAITTVGSALKNNSIDEWKLVREKLKKSKLVDVYDVFDVDEDVYACLKLSYDYLRDKETKFCFLLCSLFPEDYEISVEELVIYGIGLGLFSDTNSVEDARSRLRVMLNTLRDSCLLLDGAEECVKMHDVVRDVALCIASKGKNVFLSKSGMGSVEWSKQVGWEQYTAISLLSNKIEELPVDLVCPKLEILILSGVEDENDELKISDECLEGMKALRVLSLENVDLSLKSVQFLTNLKTLMLIDCKVRDISYLVQLKKLEILWLQSSSLDELPRELSELHKLRWLIFHRPGKGLVRIPSNLIQRCSQLEELYISERVKQWEVEEKSVELSNASLFELNFLPQLVSLHLQIDATCLPKDFAFPSLQRYEICVNTGWCESSYKRTLKISNIDATSLIAFKALYGTLQYLHLEETIGCQNILPSVDQSGLNELKSLELEDCNDLKCILDTSGKHVPANALTNLVELSLDNLTILREICCGGTLPRGFLEKLETVFVTSCPDICTLFPTEFLLGLHKLKEVKISSCEKLQEVFQFETEGLWYVGKENDLVLLPSLTELKLKHLPELKYLWKGPTHYINLQSLTSLYIYSCKKLEHVFPISVAIGLVQLEQLTIQDSHQLKQVFFMDGKSEENVVERDEKDIILPKLRELTLTSLSSLTNFLPESYHVSWPALEVLEISKCSNLTTFISQVKMQNQEQNTCSLFQTELPLRLHKLKEVEISSCEKLQEVFQFQTEGLCYTGKENDPVPLSSFAKLSLINLPQLKYIWNGRTPHHVNLQILTSLYMESCERLEHIFPISVARGLIQLQQLTVQDSHQLKQVFFMDDESKENEAGRHGKDIILPKLRTLTLARLDSLTSFLPESYHVSWPALEVLKIQKCSSLTTFISQVKMQNQGSGVLSLQNLTEVYVTKCNRLRHLFSSTLARNLLQLRGLIIEECEELEQIIFKDDEEDHLQSREEIRDKDGVDVMNAKEPLLLPQLQRLSVKALPRLTSFCATGFILISMRGSDLFSQKLGDSSLRNLSEVHVSNCNKLRHLLSVTLARNLLQLRKLSIEKCEELEHMIFKDDEEDHLQSREEIRGKHGVDVMNTKEIVLLPQLKTLFIKALSRLTSLYPMGFVLNCLEAITIDGFQDNQMCFRILSLSCLRDVKSLYIWDCGVKELDFGLCKTSSSTHTLTFQNLTYLCVIGCHKLRRIVVPNLLQLNHLAITNCDELEEIIIVEDDEVIIHKDKAAAADDVTSYHKQLQLVLPRLEKLWLQYLGSLSKFCPVNYHFLFPSLERLFVEGCGKIETRFSYSRGENGSVHVHAEAATKPLKEGGNDDQDEQPSPPETTLDITCFDSDYLQKRLPPYVKKK